MSLLEIDNLSLSIHGEPILEGVSLSAAPGEIVGIIGESGSGKSLTALSIMGLPPEGAATSGRIRLDGEELLGLSERKLCGLRGRTMGMVFQEPMTALNPLQTIGAQVAETIRIHRAAGRAEARRRACEILTRVGLPPDAFPRTRYPHELSGGQRQRVGIAIAIALHPKLLIADEPTTALDVTTQAQVLTLLKRLAQDLQMGLLFISHDLAVVSEMADRIVVMQKGRVVETGATADILAYRRHPYTEALFDASTHQVSLPPRPAAGAPLLELSDVVRSYPLRRRSLFGKRPRLNAVDKVSFTLHRGERLGLVGESGCGKSTLARAILGLEELEAGRITMDGAPVFAHGARSRAVRRKIQVVFQDPYGSFNPRLRVRRLVAEPFHLLDDPPEGAARTAAIAEALEAVGLAASDAEKYIHEFSGGQRQRIAIARALIIAPELVVFDEAVSALDVSVRAQVLDLLADLCRRRALSWLFISHDLSVVRTVTDRVMVMQAGRIVETGETEAVFRAPQHAYTKTLLAATPTLPDAFQTSAARRAEDREEK